MRYVSSIRSSVGGSSREVSLGRDRPEVIYGEAHNIPTIVPPAAPNHIHSVVAPKTGSGHVTLTTSTESYKFHSRPDCSVGGFGDR